jgi:NMD protein affecting ribosome stability and mRNA decay
MAARTRAGNPPIPTREDKMYSQGRKDPYQDRKKITDPAQCPQCGLYFLKGRWTWKSTYKDTASELCPACRRINDRVAAGVVQLAGPFLQEHRYEIQSLIENEERKEKQRHPLERLMKTRFTKSGLRVETTGLHLARRIGMALQKAYQGELETEYLKGQYKVRINWMR